MLTLYSRLPFTAGFFTAPEARGANVLAVCLVSFVSCLSRSRVVVVASAVCNDQIMVSDDGEFNEHKHPSPARACLLHQMHLCCCCFHSPLDNEPDEGNDGAN